MHDNVDRGKCTSVLHLSYSRSGGGAAEAAYRLYRALCKRGNETSFRYLGNQIDCRGRSISRGGLFGIAKYCNLAKHYSARIVQLCQKSDNLHWHSVSYFPSWLDKELNRSQHEIIHLHWVQAEFISIESIGRLTKKIVWTLHDSWPYCGSEHHPRDSADSRFISGYTSKTRDSGSYGADLDKWCWKRKLKSWNLKNFTFISPSTWGKEQALQSYLLKGCNIEVIPNIVDNQFFSCGLDKMEARSRIGLSEDCIVLAIGAAFFLGDKNKGAGIIRCLLNDVVRPDPRITLLIFGTKDTEKTSIIKEFGDLYHRVRIFPFLNKLSLSQIFVGSDLVIVPSRLESFGLIAAEAQAAGVPVIAYKTSGLMDVVADGVTGCLVEAFNENQLLREIKMLTKYPERMKSMGKAARKRAYLHFSADEVAAKHERVYSHLTD